VPRWFAAALSLRAVTPNPHNSPLRELDTDGLVRELEGILTWARDGYLPCLPPSNLDFPECRLPFELLTGDGFARRIDAQPRQRARLRDEPFCRWIGTSIERDGIRVPQGSHLKTIDFPPIST
jgi:hypothetical protein